MCLAHDRCPIKGIGFEQQAIYQTTKINLHRYAQLLLFIFLLKYSLLWKIKTKTIAFIRENSKCLPWTLVHQIMMGSTLLSSSL